MWYFLCMYLTINNLHKEYVQKYPDTDIKKTTIRKLQKMGKFVSIDLGGIVYIHKESFYEFLKNGDTQKN